MSTVRISQYTGNISASNITVTQTGSFGRIEATTITASLVEVDANTIKIGGESFNKANLTDLKAGRPIATDNQTALKHPGDDQSFVKMKKTVPGRVDHVVSGRSALILRTSSIQLGVLPNALNPSALPGAPLSLRGTVVELTGSTTVSGSFNTEGDNTFDGNTTITGSLVQSGSTTFTGGGFTVNNLLNVLANFGSTGIPTGSGEGGVSAGDINLDGVVSVNDLLLVIAGMGNPNILVNDLTIPQNTNYQLVGPSISVSQSVSLSVGNNSFLHIT